MSDHDRQEILRLFDQLFLYTDAKRWSDAEALFTAEPLPVDMTSLTGGSPAQLTARQLFEGFAAGLHPGKVSHHMTSNAVVTVDGDRADVLAHGYAFNFVPALPAGQNVWETWGVYEITARRSAQGWRLAGFTYRSKLTRGPDAVRTHSLSA